MWLESVFARVVRRVDLRKMGARWVEDWVLISGAGGPSTTPVIHEHIVT